MDQVKDKAQWKSEYVLRIEQQIHSSYFREANITSLVLGMMWFFTFGWAIIALALNNIVPRWILPFWLVGAIGGMFGIRLIYQQIARWRPGAYKERIRFVKQILTAVKLHQDPDSDGAISHEDIDIDYVLEKLRLIPRTLNHQWADFLSMPWTHAAGRREEWSAIANLALSSNDCLPVIQFVGQGSVEDEESSLTSTLNRYSHQRGAY